MKSGRIQIEKGSYTFRCLLLNVKTKFLFFTLLLLCNALLGYHPYVDANANLLIADGSLGHLFVRCQEAVNRALTIEDELGLYLGGVNLGNTPIYECVDNIDEDPLFNNPEIGAVCYPHHMKEYFERYNPSVIYWLSFPVLDDRTYTDGVYWNELGHMFESQMQNAPNSQLNQILWSYDGEMNQMKYLDPNWVNSTHSASQPIGYKVQFNPGTNHKTVIVNGFKADPNAIPVSWVVATEVNGQMRPFENWIGYFVSLTSRAGTARRMIPSPITWWRCMVLWNPPLRTA